MFKLLFSLLVIYLLYVLWKRVSGKTARIEREVEHRSLKKDLPPGEMVSCAKCQTFVLKAEAIERAGKFYCSRHCVP